MAEQPDRPRVVVINDDNDFLDLMDELLESEGYDATTRKQWSGAYQHVKEVRPDLVILDLIMSSQERGWQILELLTLDPVTRPIPVIVCSAATQALRDRRQQLDEKGVYALEKPFDLPELLSLIKRALASERAVSGAA